MLTDKFGRKIEYLRISVTDRCNLRCVAEYTEEILKSIDHLFVMIKGDGH